MLLGFKTEPIQLFPKEKTVTHNVLATALLYYASSLYMYYYTYMSHCGVESFLK